MSPGNEQQSRLTSTVMTPAFVRLSLRHLLLLLIAVSPARGEASSTHTFSFDARDLDPRPATVHLAGSFNGWSREATPMKDDGTGVFRVEVPLSEGTWYYKFVLNGDKWVNDGAADKELEIDDGHGGKNSGLVIGPDARKLPPAKPDHINVDALVHAPGDLKDLNVSSVDTVRFRLRAQAGDVREALVNIEEPGGVRTYALHALGDRRLGIESFGGFVSVGGAPARYWFTLYDGKCKVLFTPEGKRVYGPDDSVDAKPTGFAIPRSPRSTPPIGPNTSSGIRSSPSDSAMPIHRTIPADSGSNILSAGRPIGGRPSPAKPPETKISTKDRETSGSAAMVGTSRDCAKSCRICARWV
jgi:hypothetical protein